MKHIKPNILNQTINIDHQEETVLVSEGFDSVVDLDSLVESSKKKHASTRKTKKDSEQIECSCNVTFSLGGEDLILQSISDLYHAIDFVNSEERQLSFQIEIGTNELHTFGKLLKAFIEGDASENLLIFKNIKVYGIDLFKEEIYDSTIIKLGLISNNLLDVCVKLN